jgi:hypothetical protein
MHGSSDVDTLEVDAEAAPATVLAEIDRVVERLNAARELLLVAAPEAADVTVTDHTWTVRDVIGHLSAYYPAEEIDGQTRRLLALAEAGRSAGNGTGAALDEANEAIRQASAERGLGELFDVILAGRAALRAAVAELPGELLVRPVEGTTWGPVVPVWRVVLESTVWHDEAHLEDIGSAMLGYDPVLYYQYLER